MPGPWEKFQKPAEQEQGPWVKYGGANAASHTPEERASVPPGSPSSRFAQNFIDAVNPVPGLVSAATHPIDTGKALVQSQMAEFPKAAQEWRSGNPIGAFGHGLAGVLPLVGPAAANAGEQIGEGDIAGGLGKGAGLIGSVTAAPAVTRGAGRLIGAPAEPLAESALGIRGQTHAYGATPGKAILEETRGIRPATIADSARSRMEGLARERNSLPATREPSLVPGRNLLQARSDTAAGFGSRAEPEALKPMRQFLTTPSPGFQGSLTPSGEIAPTQPVPQFLGMRGQFNKDFVRNWSPAASTKDTLGAARDTYHALSQEYHDAVPGSKPLDQRISSLVPVAERGRLSDLNAGPTERILNRATRPTGGLVAPLLAFGKSGPVGAGTMITAQELAASPAAKMMAARGIYGAGKGLGSVPTQRAAQAGPFLRRRDGQ